MASHRQGHKGKLPEGYLPEDRLFALLESSQEDSRIQLYTPPGELVRIGENEVNQEPENETDETTYTHYSNNRLHPAFRHTSRGPNFLDWVRFEEADLPPRENTQYSSPTDIWKPLSKFKADLPGGVHIEGLNGVAESVHNLFRSAKRLDFMEQRRAIRLPVKTYPASLSTVPKRELERLELELFDVSKYNGACEHLTALAWSEDGRTGSITLYEVSLDDRFRRERDVPVGVRPVAAMSNVPKPVLVEMRKHEKVRRKVVFVPSDEEDQGFKWKANPNRGPTYVKLPRRGNLDIASEGSASLAPPRSPRGIRPERRGSASSHTSSMSRHSSRSRLADADGVRATIPQFVALLHASRAILEDIQSTSIDPIETEDGDILPTVTLTRPPRANSHEGSSIHVTVLIPSDSDWTDDQIVWTDRDGLVEFRHKKYWDLIESERRREPNRRRHSSHSGHSGHSTRRDRSWSPRVRSRSQHSTH